MSLFKRHKKWWTRVVRGGVVYQKPLKTSNRKQAEKLERDYLDELDQKAFLPNLSPDMSFGALAARYIAVAGPKPYNFERLKALLPFWADIPIGKITKNTAREYRQYRHSLRKLTDNTINKDLQAAKHLLYFALDEGLLPINPLSRVSVATDSRTAWSRANTAKWRQSERKAMDCMSIVPSVQKGHDHRIGSAPFRHSKKPLNRPKICLTNLPEGCVVSC